MSRSVALMQPQFLPWIGHLELLAEADVFVALDDFQVVKQSWGVRNRLFVAKGEIGWVSIDLMKSTAGPQNFLEAREFPEGRWRQRLWNLLRHTYGKANAVDSCVEFCDRWLSRPSGSLAERNLSCLYQIRDQLGIDTEILRSSELSGVVGVRSERLRSILRAVGADSYLCAAGSVDYMMADGGWEGTRVLVQNHRPIPYFQYHSEEFVPRLSFLDALANQGWLGMQSLLGGTAFWDELGQTTLNGQGDRGQSFG